MRYVIVDDRMFGTPAYVAENEADAARWLKTVAADARAAGKEATQRNSLQLSVREAGSSFKNYEVHQAPSWDDPKA
jgi:hypothetical protein